MICAWRSGHSAGMLARRCWLGLPTVASKLKILHQPQADVKISDMTHRPLCGNSSNNAYRADGKLDGVPANAAEDVPGKLVDAAVGHQLPAPPDAT